MQDSANMDTSITIQVPPHARSTLKFASKMSMLVLPDELIVAIMERLAADAHVLRVALSCKRISRLLYEQKLWRLRAARRFGSQDGSGGLGNTDWKIAYRNQGTLRVPASKIDVPLARHSIQQWLVGSVTRKL
ncbi:hypothetical protein M427DRAFT_189538 [Gonapodya prolifera JEL478]|uniref:F-box domain-containing protein n=1 Tax=Gonapodya prolifera (strain JEL478) TaxID=1344416 RepID=A0A139A089_GONPJ|nr:hypothetical protein M427DRAFT_189538 [Gonapodya prolifera JEL478]|eukprot:KXS10180.1 hypothetical protein M427DRAFT_189538 [Gonapodya prolifera JEL478]